MISMVELPRSLDHLGDRTVREIGIESTWCLKVYEDGSYLYFSPRASILSFASFSAHVCMLERTGQFLGVRGKQRRARGIGLVVQQYCSQSHRPEHPKVPDVFPILFHPLLAWR